MISVPEFVQGIRTEDPTYDITHNFGKMMVLYSLLGGCPDLTISTNHIDNTTSFLVEARTIALSTYINHCINGICYTVYGDMYSIESEQNKKSNLIRIKKM